MYFVTSNLPKIIDYTKNNNALSPVPVMGVGLFLDNRVEPVGRS